LLGLEDILNCYFGKLIARYNSAKDSLTALLASDTEIGDNEIADADRELSAAFEAIMQAEVRDTWQVQARIRFMTEQINERCENQEIIKRLTRRVLDDVSEVSTEKDPNYVNLLYRSG
jgi:hypothetical protein